MALPYIDPNTVHNPTTGQPIPAAWGDTVRDDLEVLIAPANCGVYATTAQTVGTGATLVALSANAEYRDTAGMHSTVVDPAKIIVPYNGLWRFDCRVEFAGNASGNYRRLALEVDATTTISLQTHGPAGTQPVRASGGDDIYLLAGSFVRVMVSHDRGADLDVQLQSFSARFVGR